MCQIHEGYARKRCAVCAILVPKMALEALVDGAVWRKHRGEATRKRIAAAARRNRHQSVFRAASTRKSDWRGVET